LQRRNRPKKTQIIAGFNWATYLYSIISKIDNMQLQFNTDKNIQGTDTLKTIVSEKINHGLKHFANKITRIEVHLSDQNADKAGPEDIQCKIEARIKGMQPLMVASANDSKEKAVDDAVDKMKASLRTVLGKLKNK